MTHRNEEATPDTEQKKFYFYEAPQTQQVLHYYISDVVEAPTKYTDMIHRIKTARSGDVVYIYLNTPGGRIDTGVQMISAMKASQAHIVTVLEGEVCSLGTLLFLSGDEFIVHDNCLFMIHNFSGGTYGKGHEQAAQLEATIKWFTKLAQETYKGFLTDDELERVIKGEDLWFGSDEVRSRLDKMIKFWEKEAKAKERTKKKTTKKS